MYLRGDVITVSAKSNEGKPRPAVIIQANWVTTQPIFSLNTLMLLYNSEIEHNLK